MIQFIYHQSLKLAISWAIIIFVLCATPGQYIPSANWLELLSFDKFVHAGIFFILTALSLTVTIKHNQSNKIRVIYFFICVLYGLSLEFMQAFFFSNRSADWEDFAANTFGCIMAVLLFKRIKLIANRINA